ncbi:MAG TPA: PD-(D/E)XK nuclease family protein [Anaerolineae bacterium]|nr:PD-(D/E)XK nuclease family protein [Anaerolineae bacterium]
MGWLLLIALLLGGLGIWLLFRAQSARRKTGLPRGRVTYVDTDAWDRCERPLFSNRHRLTGRPDYLVQTKECVIPVEVKSGIAPNQPYLAHVLQLAAYCLLVEEQEGRAPGYGILKYDDRAFEVNYGAELHSELLATLDAIRHDLESRDVDRDHDEPARCRSCGYRKRCDQRLA